MIYTIFLYQNDTGLLIYEKSFQEISTGKMEMFSSFFSAIKSVVSELVLEGSKQLKNIDLGDYTVIINTIPNFKIDLVIIADKEDSKLINKLTPKIIKLLQKYKELFISWDGDREEFNILELPLTELVMNNVKDVRKSLLGKPEHVLESIWSHKKELSEEKLNNLIQERDLLIYKIENSHTLTLKLAMSEKVVKLSEKLKDESTFMKYQDEVNRLKNEIKDTRFKLNYYLDKIKSSLNEAVDKLGTHPLHMGDYKNTYLNLYSFSTKLKLLLENGWEIYRELANKLIEKDEYSEHELSETIQALLKMSLNLDDYLN
ncbi:MAG: hypothetical protein ACFE85_18995 [Candidatus Hodarchaeota archaeon]